jgi:hypothetical protein
MASLHDPAYRSAIESRIRALTPQATRQWGKMSPDQMLWHVNFGLTMALGEASIQPKKAPLPRAVLKFMVLNMPWPKGAPTAPEFIAGDRYDFEAERARCLTLLDRLANKPLDSLQNVHPMFGLMRGTDVSRLQAKHLHHHLRQFGV